MVNRPFFFPLPISVGSVDLEKIRQIETERRETGAEGGREREQDEEQQKIATTRRAKWNAGESRLDGPLANR